MGFISDIAGKIEKFWKFDKEAQNVELARGTTNAVALQGYGNDYGYSSKLSSLLAIEQDLLSRYADYEEMDDYGELSSALDIYADDATQPDTEINRTIWTTSKDANLQKILNDLHHRRLRLDEEMWEIARSLCKYGNDFEELLVTNEGVVGLNHLAPQSARRVEDCYGALSGFVQVFDGSTGVTTDQFEELLQARNKAISCEAGYPKMQNAVAFEDWEVAHFRLRSKYRRSAYGMSVLDSSRWIWRRLMMVEDAAILFRLQKSMERYAFYVDVGDQPGPEAIAYVNKIRQQYRKKRFVNNQTGKLELRFDPASPDEDFWIPSRAGRDATRIDVVASPVWQTVDDLNYFYGKLFATLKVPKSYLGQDQEVARATLSSQDVRFARTVLRVQRELKNGVNKIDRVHLAALGIDPAKAEFDNHMTVPSAIFELAQLEVRNARADLATRMADFFPTEWLLQHVFGLSDQETKQVLSTKSAEVVQAAINAGRGEAEAQKLMNDALPAEESISQGAEVKARTRRALTAMGPVEKENKGSSASEKRAAMKLDEILATDHQLARRLEDIKGLLMDIRSVQGRPAPSAPRRN